MKAIKSIIKKCLNMLDIDIRKMSPYEKNLFGWLIDYNVMTILDIGAYRGIFSLEINKFLPNAKIFAFEPIRESYEELLENTKKIKSIKIYNIALGNSNEKTLINKYDFKASSSLLKTTKTNITIYPYIGKANKEEISIYKLDDFVVLNNLNLEPNIFIKMDVQGFENRVIRGGEDTFKKAKIVMTEVSFQQLYEEQASFDDIYKSLRHMGYDFKGVIDRELHPENGLPVYADVLFIKN
jgi:FkbM family methyltransferase